MSTLLEVCPAAASDEQSVSGKRHALITGHQRHAPVSVSRRLSHRQILRGEHRPTQGMSTLLHQASDPLLYPAPSKAVWPIIAQHWPAPPTARLLRNSVRLSLFFLG